MVKIAFDVAKVMNVAGVVLGLAGTILSSMSQQKTMDKTIEQKVAEALKNH